MWFYFTYIDKFVFTVELGIELQNTPLDQKNFFKTKVCHRSEAESGRYFNFTHVGWPLNG